jgi:hypothetical protein
MTRSVSKETSALRSSIALRTRGATRDRQARRGQMRIRDRRREIRAATNRALAKLRTASRPAERAARHSESVLMPQM